MRAVLLLLLLAGAALFVWLTSASLPPLVASHFGAPGGADGFMPRPIYLGLMLALVVLVPALIALSGQMVRLLPASLVNLPHRRYWLAPERSAATVSELSRRSLVPAGLVAVFLCFAHRQGVQANLAQPKTLAAVPFWAEAGAVRDRDRRLAGRALAPVRASRRRRRPDRATGAADMSVEATGLPAGPGVSAADPLGHSGTPLAKKLGIGERSVVFAPGAPAGYRALLGPLAESVRFESGASETTDIAHLFVTRRQELARLLAKLREALRPTATVWVSWPKQSSRVASEVSEDTVRELALALVSSTSRSAPSTRCGRR